MNQEDNKQAVTEVEPDENSPVENQDARDDEPTMDELLDEIESTQQEAPQEVQPKTETQDTGIADRLATLEQENKDRDKADLIKDIETGVQETVGRFLENDTISKVYDDDEVEGLIQIEASRNPRISTAFGLRHSEPAKWKKIEASLMKKIEDKAAGKTSQNNEDREAVEEAVRGVSNLAPVTESKVPSQSDLAGMTDRELADLKRELDPDYGA